MHKKQVHNLYSKSTNDKTSTSCVVTGFPIYIVNKKCVTCYKVVLTIGSDINSCRNKRIERFSFRQDVNVKDNVKSGVLCPCLDMPRHFHALFTSSLTFTS